MAEAASEHPTVPPLAAPKRRYALTVLLVIYILNFLDRQVVNILAEPIKLELGLALGAEEHLEDLGLAVAEGVVEHVAACGVARAR